MSKDKDYIITTLSNNLTQRNKPVFSQGVVNPISLREKCSPYTVTAITGPASSQIPDEPIPKFPFGCIEAPDGWCESWDWDGEKWIEGPCLFSYLKFEEYYGEQDISMSCDSDWSNDSNNAGYLNNLGQSGGASQTASLTIGNQVWAHPMLFRGYPPAPAGCFGTGSFANYPASDPRPCYLMSSSATGTYNYFGGGMWEPYDHTYSSTYNFALAYPTMAESSRMKNIYKPFDTSFTLSMWYKLDTIPYGAEGFNRNYGQFGLFCLNAASLEALTGESYFGVAFGSSSVDEKYFMHFGYADTQYNGTNFHVYSDAGGGAENIIDTGSWHHIVLSVSGTAYNERIGSFWFDGVPLTCSLVNGLPPRLDNSYQRLCFFDGQSPF